MSLVRTKARICHCMANLTNVSGLFIIIIINALHITHTNTHTLPLALALSVTRHCTCSRSRSLFQEISARREGSRSARSRAPLAPSPPTTAACLPKRGSIAEFLLRGKRRGQKKKIISIQAAAHITRSDRHRHANKRYTPKKLKKLKNAKEKKEPCTRVKKMKEHGGS
jgi:hypothetical protein